MTRVNKGRFDLTLKRRALLEKLIRDEGLAPRTRHAIPPREDRASAPLSFAQRRLWFIDQLEPGDPAYNEHFALRLTGSLNISALRQTINEIVRRHESLRTTFRVIDQEPAQIIAPELELEIAVANIEALTGSESNDPVLDLAVAEARRPFHLEHGPLVRMTLLRIDEGHSQLLFTIHHIVSDGWSAGILVKELASIYPAFLDGLPSALVELTVQYGDFAVWQEQWLRENVLAAQLPYWRQKMAGAPATLDLRVGNSRPAVQRHSGAREPLHISRELSQKIRTYSRQTRSTVFMVLLAGFEALLYRYAEQRDIVLATPVAGRNRAELEGLIGFFANTLLLRTEIAEHGGFADLLSGVKDTAMSALAHQDVPFEILVEELNPERDLSYNPLCQVLFVLQDAPAQEFTLPGLIVEPLRISTGAAKFDLTLDISDSGEELSGFLEYNTDLFDGVTIQRMAGHFINLLNAAAEDPSRSLRDLPMLSEPERHQLQVEWNGARLVNNDARCIHRLFESQAERAPDAIALADEKQQLSYWEVNRRANQLGHFLRSAGVGSEVKVALCLERAVELVVAILGVFKAGGAYVPLDPAYPRERLEFILEDAGAEIVLLQHRLMEKLPRHGARTIEVDGDRESIAKHDYNNLSDVAEPRNLAYVIYTSGSTGRPKGVAIEHRSAAALIAWALEVYGPEELAGVLCSTSICFDLSVFEMFVPLACGGRVILAESALQLPQLKARHSVTLLNTVPSAMTELLRVDAVPASVRTVNLAGEPLKLPLAQQINKRKSVQRLFNLYGPSEDTTYSTWSLLGRQIETAPLIGRPIANTQVYITDTALQLVPVAVPGELYIGGDGLARGYLNRPDLTADRFIPDSFGEAPGGRVYRTGDQGRYRPDGEIEFLGRQDHQVKVRGFRIELGEIEAALIGCEKILEAIVVVEGEEAETRLIAYYVAEGEIEDISEPRQQLRQKLPDYMIPSVFVRVAQMPLTSNGKVDRRALARTSREAAQEQRGYEPPQTEVEQRLAGLWAAVLKLDRVGRNDNFFEIGGHSLLGARVISRVREVFRVELPLRSLFESPTVKELSSMIEQGLSDSSQAADMPITRAGLCRAPASFAQERLWFLDQLETAGSAYNMAGVVRLRGQVDVAALWSSLAGVVRRHEVLRTNFAADDGQLMQVIIDSERVHKAVIDLSGLNDGRQTETAERLMRIEAERPFNLATEPLIRACLLKLSEREHLLELVIHHIVSDGWSLGILIREISAQYGAFLKGQQSPLPEPPIQYADYAAWQRKQLKGGLLEKQLGYWRDQLRGVPVLELPTNRVRPRVQSIAGGKERMTIPAGLTRRLNELSRQEGLTLFMTLLGAFQLLMMRWSGQTDVAVGTPVAGRTRGEVEELIGLFVNTVALRATLNGGESVRGMLSRVREVTLEAYANQDAPFEILVEQLRPVRDLSYTPLFQVFFNMLNLPETAIELAGLAIEPEAPPEAGSKFDLTLYTREQDDELDCALAYNTDLFDRSCMAALLDQFQHLLLQMVDDPNREVAGLSLVTPGVEGILPNPYEQLNSSCDETVLTRFASQARRAPKRLAVIGPHDAWTYRELDARSNQLANCLLERGVRPQEIVAVYGCRSGSLVWAVLGILKAGAAFVILDHSYPATRLTSYLETAKPAGLICLQEAGKLPGTLRDYVETKAYRCRLELPGLANAGEDAALMNYSDESPNVRVAPEDLAYVAFTSGSAGEPKAVAGAHGPIAHFLRWHSRTFKLEETDRFSMLSGLAHDPLLRDIFSPLWVGAALCIPAQDDIETPGHLSDWMGREEISVAHLVPAMGQVLTGGEEIERDYTLGCLRYVFMGGDALTTQLVSRLRGLAPSVTCVNFYGATETPQAMSYFVVPADEDSGKQRLPGSDRVLPIGRGIEDVQLLVLSSSRQLCGVGELGEIYVRTPFLAKGYLADEELTAERFITNPFTKAEGDRLYRTGDLGRYSPEGLVEYCGRLDQQLKIRGFRIDPTEIEITLCRHPGVDKAVVLAQGDDANDQRLVAYVVARSKSAVSIGKLRAHLQERLPDYMTPTAFSIVDEIPLTPNGKVDKAALAARPRTIDVDLAGGYAAPRTATEQILSGVWSELLGLERVGTRDNFFELGGHSLLAMRVALRVRREFAVEMPVRRLFERPTIAELADLIEQEMGNENAAPLPVLRRISREHELSLSFAQERIYILQQMDPESSFFNVHQTFRFKGALDVPALTTALNEVVRRHEALRTSFEIRSGRAVQVIADRICIDVPAVDLSHLTEDDRQAQVHDLASRQSRRAFDLTKVPLLRVSLLQLSEGDHAVLLTVHHIISDGWSVGLLIGEVADLYEAFSTGMASSLPEVDFQYADVAAWQREWMRGEVLDQQLAYWKNKLADAPSMLDLPADYPRPPVRTQSGARHAVTLPAPLAAQLAAMDRQYGTTLFITMLTALKIVMFRWTGQQDIVVGTVTANRNSIETEKLIGCFMNFAAVRSQVSGDETGLELLEQIRANVFEMYAHQDCPFESVVEAVKPERKPHQNPLFNVALLVQNFPRNYTFSESLEASIVETGDHPSLLDLRLVAEEHGDNIKLWCEYGTDLFAEETIRHFVDCYCDTLSRLVREPETKLSSFELDAGLQASACRSRERDQKQVIAIASTFTAEPVEAAINFWMERLGIPAQCEFAPYNQVFQQLLDPSSLLSRNQNGVNVVLVCPEDWSRYAGSREEAHGLAPIAAQEIDRNAANLVDALKRVADSGTPCVLCMCPASPAEMEDLDRATSFRLVEELIASELAGVSGVCVVTTSEIAAAYPVSSYYDARADGLGHIRYTPAFFTALGTMVARKIQAIRQPPYKVVVLDCDDTLWGGVCGEDGAGGVVIDASQSALQEFVVRQHDEGMLVCLCSKNNEEDVLEVFKSRTEMVLRREHLAAWRINWEPKSENLKSLAAELRLGLDAFIFIDNDPVVCLEVQTNCPEVLTLQLPAEAGRIPGFLRHVWAFDRLKLTDEDRKRTALYRQDRLRYELRNVSLSLDDFIATIELKVSISEMRTEHVARAAQLTQRTNQFNFTGRKRNESEIQRLVQDGYDCVVVEVSDRFGDYGLVGLMILQRAALSLQVDTFLLSCRALGRNVERHMLAKLGAIALGQGLSRIDIPFLTTKKNQPALDFLWQVDAGFKRRQPGGWILEFPAERAASLAPDWKGDPQGAGRAELIQQM